MENLSSRIKRGRENKGWSASKLAEVAETTHVTIANIEKGSMPRADLLIRIANALELDVNELTGQPAQVLKEPKEKYQVKTALQRLQSIPYYDIDVSAGNKELSNEWLPSKPTAIFDISVFGRCDFALPVHGRSMMDDYNPGDIVAYKEINDWRNYIEYGNAYLVVTESRRMLKYIRKSKIAEHYLLCSKNEAMGFDPFDINFNDIHNIYIVVGKIEKKVI